VAAVGATTRGTVVFRAAIAATRRSGTANPDSDWLNSSSYKKEKVIKGEFLMASERAAFPRPTRIRRKIPFSMQIKLFTLPAFDFEQQEEDMNKFLCSTVSFS
jgi:hypothetical protein